MSLFDVVLRGVCSGGFSEPLKNFSPDEISNYLPLLLKSYPAAIPLDYVAKFDPMQV